MKYVLLDESKVIADGSIVHRIEGSDGRAGGFVGSLENLSQEGLCWLHGDSLAYGSARVMEDAQVFGEASGNCVVGGEAQLYGRAFGHAVLRGRCKVYGTVGGNQVIEGDSVLYGNIE